MAAFMKATCKWFKVSWGEKPFEAPHINIRNMKQPLNDGLFLKRFIESLNLIKNLGYNHTLIWTQS